MRREIVSYSIKFFYVTVLLYQKYSQTKFDPSVLTMEKGYPEIIGIQ